ncbi:excalibur calcium-binding domain-containing protein [Streptomyces sp. NPDC053493]|uniref:excalibur calcium-binding domain-containing protein n=1 Tax=Streptomyces sp. NPDC053493 TaxID=3365705 RepID=UPI0037D1D64B
MYPPPHPYPYPPVPVRVRRWWQHPALIIVLLVLVPPVGIVLTWTSLWSQRQKTVATVLAGLWFLAALLGDSGGEPKGDDAKPAPRPTATRTATESPTPTPTPTPTETETAAMPALLGGTYADAQGVLAENQGRVYAAYKDVQLAAEHDDWLVCFQRPDAGQPVTSMTPVVYVTEPGVPCPKSPSELLHKPTPKPRPKPTPTRAPTRAPEPAVTDDTSGGSGGGDVYYENCTAVRAAGAAPIHRGDPGYARHLDRDGDGVGCEG